VINDCSTDNTAKILQKFEGKIKAIRTPKNTGNKSRAQEFGLGFVQGDIFIATDGDTLLDKNFVKRIEEDFSDPSVVAVGGYIKSLKYNWLTACRAFEYSIGQNLHKLAQSYINYMFVIPGAAGAFRTQVFRENITFDHDTLTEDLDFTYRFHKKGLKIKYDREAVVFTQDPANLKSYINQMRRWYGGGWQNLRKHLKIAANPAKALELSLVYIEGVVFSILLFALPLIDIRFLVYFFISSAVVLIPFTIFAAFKEKRPELILVFIPYLLLVFVNAAVFLEQLFKEIILRKKNLTWFHPDRVKI
jgi:cellulose synthase/poly-beta-1,6-N-acetylglucosamine synthase-like glycosyltransferase